MRVYISEVFSEIAKAKNRNDKKKVLEGVAKNHIVKYILQGAFDPSIQWNVPTTIPDFNPADTPIDLTDLTLDHVMPKCSMFVKGHPKNSGLHDKKIKQLLINILEQLHKDEGKIFVQMLKKKLKCKGLTEKLVLEVFPDLYRKVE